MENKGQSRLLHRRVLHHGAMQLLAAKAKTAMKPDAQARDFTFRRNKVGFTLSQSFTARLPA